MSIFPLLFFGFRQEFAGHISNIADMIYADSFVYMPELNTPRLRLRRLTMRDAADIYHYSRDTDR